MGLFNFLKVKAQPIEVKVSANQSLRRNIGRIVNLYRSIESGDSRKELIEELNIRKHNCLEYGHTPPNNLQEALQLMEKVYGN